MRDLYETYYKLSADPFRLSPDHRFVLEHRSYAKSKSYLEYALHRGEGFIIITGAAGTGKTTLINHLLAKLDKTRIQVATLTSTQLESRDLLHMVAASFGLPLTEMDKVTLLLELEEFLKQQCQKGRQSVLIVDEAQGLSSGALEELRLLANLQLNNRLLLQIFLVGQEPLRELIDKPDMDHLRQRVVAASHMEPLKLNETVDYVEHRLNRVGWQGDPTIDGEALVLIHRFSGGIPRRINLICSRLLLYGAMEKKHALVGADAASVIEDLQQEHLMAPVAGLGNGTTGAPSRIGVPAEQLAAVSVHSLPRAKKTGGESTQKINARLGESGYSEVKSGGNHYTPPSFSVNKLWTEMEEPEREPMDSREDFGAPDAAAAGVAEKPVVERIQPAGPVIIPMSGEVAEPDSPAVTPTPFVESRYTPRARVDTARRPKKRTVAVVIFVSVVIGFVVLVLLGRDRMDHMDHMDRMAAAVDEQMIGEQKGAIQRDVSVTEKPVAQTLPANTGSANDSPRVSHTPLDLNTSEQPVALNPEPEQSQDEGDTGHAGLSLSGGANSLIDGVAITREIDPETEPPRPGNDMDLPTVAGPTAKSPTAALSESPVIVESQGTQVISKVASQAQVQLLTPVEQVAPSPAPPRPVPAITDVTREASEERAPSSVEVQRAGQRAEAEKRLDQRLSGRLAVVPGAQPRATVKPEVSAAPVPPKHVWASRPKLSDQKTSAAPAVVATAPAPLSTPSISPDRIQSALMAGHWTSRGKPATLLPSEITRCQQQGARVACWSMPQNIDTKYGKAIYKVEASLQDFSAAGGFRLSYRTLVKFVGTDSSESVEPTPGTESDSEHWQVTEHSMTCQLAQLSQILCHNEKGTKREYRRM